MVVSAVRAYHEFAADPSKPITARHPNVAQSVTRVAINLLPSIIIAGTDRNNLARCMLTPFLPFFCSCQMLPAVLPPSDCSSRSSFPGASNGPMSRADVPANNERTPSANQRYRGIPGSRLARDSLTVDFAYPTRLPIWDGRIAR